MPLWVDFVAISGDLKVFTVDGRGTVICAFKQKRKIGRIGKTTEFGNVSDRKITDAQKGAGFFHSQGENQLVRCLSAGFFECPVEIRFAQIKRGNQFADGNFLGEMLPDVCDGF